MTKGSERKKIAFVGLGNMGSPMAARLVSAGYDVAGADLAPAARTALTDAGGRAFENVVDAVQDAQIVILMLPNSDVVESVLLGQPTMSRVAADAVVVDMSSSEPLRTRKLAETLRTDFNVGLIDAPVSGGVKGAVNGTLTIMTGGTQEQVELVSECLTHLGTVRHTGPVGSGHAIKAFNNLLSATHLLVTSEALLAGERFGLDMEIMLEVINSSSGRSGSTENKWPNFILTESYNSGFGLQLMLKDMKIATNLAAQLGLPSLLGEDSARLWEKAAKALPAGADHTEIARWLRDQ